MAESPPEYELFSKLDAAIKDSNYPRVVEASNKILKYHPDDLDALTSKLVALIRQSKYEEALDFINDTSELKSKRFEKAFCLFKQSELDKALKLLDDSNLSVQETELKAQILYRREIYVDAAVLYEGLTQDTDNEFHEEHVTNQLACIAGSLANNNSEASLPQDYSNYSTFEQNYNTTCALLAQGKYTKALKHIETATEQCRELLEAEEGITEDEIEDEIALLRVQHGVTLQFLGKHVEAKKQFVHVLERKPDDISLVAVASMNIIALNKDEGIFDSRKKLAAVQVEGLDGKLTSSQRRTIGVNHALLLMHMNQIAACRKKLDELQSEFPEHSDLPELIRVCTNKKKSDQSVSSLEEYAASNPNASQMVKLTIAQMNIEQNKYDQAISILKDTADLHAQPGLVGVLVSLYAKQDDDDMAVKLLNDCIAAWSKPENKSIEGGEEIKFQLLQAAAEFNYDNENFKDAATMYELILAEDQQNAFALTRLITCLTKYDITAAESYGEQLPPLEFDGEPIDVDVLEKAVTQTRKKKEVVVTDTAVAVGTNASGPVAAEEKKKKKPRKRPGKLPKDYNPLIPPDAERWTPKWEKAEYKRRNRKKAALHYNLQRGTQGSATQDQIAKLNRSKAEEPKAPPVVTTSATPKQDDTASTSKTEPETPSPKKVPQNNQQKKKKKGNKKKK